MMGGNRENLNSQGALEMNMSAFEDYANLLEKMSTLSGLDFKPDPEGLVSLKVDNAYTLNLQYVEASSKILCFVNMATLPKSCGKSVYRELLRGALFGQDTAGGYFALEGESETVVYNYLFDFDPGAADPEEMLETLEKILSLVDIWAERIRGLVSSAPADSKDQIPKTDSSRSAFLRV